MKTSKANKKVSESIDFDVLDKANCQACGSTMITYTIKHEVVRAVNEYDSLKERLEIETVRADDFAEEIEVLKKRVHSHEALLETLKREHESVHDWNVEDMDNLGCNVCKTINQAEVK